MRLSEIYRQKRKHVDAHHIGKSFLNYTNFPTTFDGSLPSEALAQPLARKDRGILSLSERWRHGHGRHRDLCHGLGQRKEGRHFGDIHGWNVTHHHAADDGCRVQ